MRLIKLPPNEIKLVFKIISCMLTYRFSTCISKYKKKQYRTDNIILRSVCNYDNIIYLRNYHTSGCRTQSFTHFTQELERFSTY